MTIIITNVNNDYMNKDYKAMYGNDTVLWFWFEESDLDDAIQSENLDKSRGSW